MTHPSGRILIICFPMIRDELRRMLAGLTLCSEMDISLSKTVFAKKSSHPSIGSYTIVSAKDRCLATLEAHRYSKHQRAVQNNME